MKVIDKIGIKSIKIALAVIVSLLLGKIFKLEVPYLTALNSVIGIQGTTYVSLTNAKDRMIGTILGTIIGVITISYLPNGFIVTSIGLFIVIYACNLLNLNSSVVQACVIFLSIMLFSSPESNFIGVVVSTFIGVLVAVFINLILSPFDLKNNLNKTYYDLRENIFDLCSRIFMNSEDIDRQSFRSTMIAYKELVRAYDDEYFKVKDKDLESSKIDELYKSVGGIGFFTFSIIELRDNNLSESNILRINKILGLNIDFDTKDLDYQANTQEVLLNFHVDKLLDYLEKI